MDKLRLKSEFAYVRKHGVKYVGANCVLVVAPSPDKKLRAGIICGKHYSNKAVLRNRARRLLWESFRLLKPRILPSHLVMIVRYKMTGKNQPEVQKELLRLLKKAKLLES